MYTNHTILQTLLTLHYMVGSALTNKQKYPPFWASEIENQSNYMFLMTQAALSSNISYHQQNNEERVQIILADLTLCQI